MAAWGHGRAGLPAVRPPAHRGRPLRSLLPLPLLALALPARAAYFFVEEGQERCFHENLLEHQVMKMSYSMHDKDVLVQGQDNTTECKIMVKDPDAKVVKEHAVGLENHDGELAYLAHSAGIFNICLICRPREWWGRRKMRWSIAFDVLGDESAAGVPDLSGAAHLEKIKPTMEGVHELLARLGAITSENDYEKTFEEDFNYASASVNSDVTAFKAGQIVLITIVCGFQIHHMYRFVMRNQLINCASCLPFRHTSPIV